MPLSGTIMTVATDVGGSPQNCATASTSQHQIAQYLHLILFGSGPGYVQIAIGKRSPCGTSIERVYPQKWSGQAWRYLDADHVTAMARDIERLGRKYGNVYLTTTTYGKPTKRNKDNANPSRLVFVDDVMYHPGMAAWTETSKGNGQGIFLTDTQLDNATRERIGVAAAATLGGDKCFDVTRLMRVPGTFNTKRGERFPVQLKHCTPTVTHSRAALSAMFVQVEPAIEPVARPIEFDEQFWQYVERARSNPQAIMRRLGRNTNSLTHQQLRGDKLCRDHGRGEPNRSATLYALACNLRNTLGFTDGDIYAVLWESLLASTYGNEARDHHIRLALAAAHTKYPDAITKPTHGLDGFSTMRPLTREKPTVAAVSKTADDLLDLYREHAVGSAVLLKRKEAAKVFGVSLSTLVRLELELKERGLIVRHTPKSRAFSYVQLLDDPGSVNIAREVVSAPLEVPHEVVSATIDLAASEAHMFDEELCIGDTHHPPMAAAYQIETAEPDTGGCVPSTPRQAITQQREANDAVNVSLPTAARTALAALDVDERRPTVQRVQALLDKYFTGHQWSEVAIKRVYDDEMQARKFVRELSRLESMTATELSGLKRTCEHKQVRAHESGHAKQANLFSILARKIDAEFKRRATVATHVEQSSEEAALLSTDVTANMPANGPA